jgi:antitoxin (DNA-binding transcriptional repressor) of toxin-antitoxin stability system
MVRRQLDVEGEVVVTERGKPKYRLTPYAPAPASRPAPAKNYLARIRRFQPRPISAAAARRLHDESRGDR